ncbi:MAG: hypothetical protein JWR26_2017 [Pedosphaera sp.]|nr:hypothetical protein [Pedosphaera sp.]
MIITTKLKINAVAAILAVITELVCFSVLTTESFGSSICAFLIMPGVILGGLIDILSGGYFSGVSIILFSFLWLFLIYWIIINLKYGRRAV